MMVRRLLLAAFGAAALLSAIPVAHADGYRDGYYEHDGWRERRWREHERERAWREHEWRERHRPAYGQPYYNRGW